MTCATVQAGDNHLITFPEPNCEGRPTYWHASSNVQSVQQPIQSFVLSFDSDLTFIDAQRNLDLPFDIRIWGDRVQNTHEAVDLWRGEDDAHLAIARATHLRLGNHRAEDELRFARACMSKGTPACQDFLHFFCQSAAGALASASDVCGRFQIQKDENVHWSSTFFTTRFLIIVIVSLFFLFVLQTFRLNQKSEGKK